MARILFVSTSTTLGGAEKTLFALATSLDPARHRVLGVVGIKPDGPYAARLRARGVRVESLGLARAPRPSDASRLAAIVARERPDVVHALMYQAIQLARLAKPRAGVPYKLVSSPRVHYRARPGWSLLIDRALKGRDDLLISECEASRRYLVERLGYAPDKTLTIRNGVEPFAPSPVDRERLRRELGLDATDVLVGVAGRLDRQKGLSILVEAMARLKDAPLRCAILGEGPERARLEELIRRRRLAGRVRLLGECGETAPWLSALDLYALPSLWEGLPNALLEAMAAGLPAVASAIDGVPEAVTDGVDGALVPPSDPAALACALRALAADPARRAALGAAARATVAARFAPCRMIAEYESAYESVARP